MSGRLVAYAGIVIGLAVSVWANVQHAALQPGGADPGALTLAGFWPLGLFLALEVLTRTEWSGGAAVVVARVGVVTVALVAAVVSYLHLHGLLQHYGESALPAMVGPFAIDGLMAVSAAALLQRPTPEPAAPVEVPAPEPAPVVEVPGLVEVVTPEPVSAPQAAPEPRPLPVAAARQERPVAVTERADTDPLLLAAHQAANGLTKAGKRVTRDNLVNALRDAGHTCSNTKGGELLRQLRETA